jgi:hypothetical protein
MILSGLMLEMLLIITNYAPLDQVFDGNEWFDGSQDLEVLSTP